MSCIRTGANVLLTNYDRILHCDLFRVGDTIIAKTWPDQLDTAPRHDPHDQRIRPTHIMDLPGADSEAWSSAGVFIAPAYAVGVIGPDGKNHRLHTYGGDGGYFREDAVPSGDLANKPGRMLSDAESASAINRVRQSDLKPFFPDLPNTFVE